MNKNETIVALATPQGIGAIGVIRLSGPESIAIVSLVFSKNLTQEASHTAHFGRIKNGDRIVDEVLVTLFKDGKSYTGEEVVEISCHGSHYILQDVIRLLTEKGAVLAKPGEFTLRAFLNGKLDLSQAEAVADLIASNSEAAHKVAMHQMRGGFSDQIKKLRADLIHFASLVELELDFSEEDVEFANRDDLKDLIFKIHKVISALVESFKSGNVIKNGVPVVIAGKPNAGKSTLLNALLNEEKALVTEIEGTTRDAIEDESVIGGIVFRFIDTAGIRETEDVVESLGVKKTLEKMKEAAIVCYLFDAARIDLKELDLIIASLKEDVQKSSSELLVVANKSDLLEKDKRAIIEEKYEPIFLSAKEKRNLEILENRLLELVNLGKVGEQDVIVTNSRHHQALTGANEALMRAYEGLDSGLTGDLLAADIRQSLFHLGEITGEVTTEDLLDNIFSKFCIGK
ncbi:MAG: tRNA uridine-5-carboxymethylaminomethyl(34) synthesis GTPase MnmE [Crocinitomicaceae bacterium]|mgnify:CR=1 FL=1|nr:tRNA uridine-5-carboxymethylaminomethyl(34) synthesis GTPase MnmE [Crocinitomicaceae bacterium]|tara:strand:+ start:20267 stop:21640 length:1374 start_codon:yes stop_codon:yes gene_type:complete